MNPSLDVNHSDRESLLWLALGFTVLFGCFWDALPPVREASRLSRLAGQGRGYRSIELPLVREEKESLGAATSLKRLYRAQGQSFVLIGVDGARERHAIHAPDTCLRGSGWVVVRRNRVDIPGGEGEEVVLKKGERTRKALYWYSDGTRRHASFFRCRVESALRRFTRGYLNAEPLLLVLLTRPGEDANWDELLEAVPGIAQV